MSESKKRGHMSGLKERLGGEGKIQWETTETSKLTKKKKPYDPPFLHLFALVVVLSCISEYMLSSGSIILIIGLIISSLYSIRAVPHETIPMGDGYLPFFGHSLNVFKHWNDFFDEEAKECLKLDYKKRAYYSTCIPLKKNIIFIVDPKIIDLVFRLKFGDADKGQETKTNISPILGKGIFVSDGAIWKKHRALASRMFTVRSLRDYMFEVFVDTTDIFLSKIEEIHKANGCVDMYDMYERLTLEAFTQVAFGVPLGTIKCAPKEVQFAKSFDDAFLICTKRYFDVTWPIQKFLNIGGERTLKKHIKVINDFADEIIKKKKKEYKEMKLNKSASSSKYKLRDRYDLMSLFLKDDENISSKELRDVALNFIIAGRDTTGQLLSWFTYLITKDENKEIMENLMNEINQFIGDNVENDLDYKVINECQYLEHCLLETLRLHPSVPHLVRYAKTDITLPNGDIIRKNDGIVIPTYAMGRMPFIWDNPLKFNPDRFKGKTYPPSQYPAFNIPPRLCLGKHVALLEAKIAVIKLFKKYKVIPVENQTIIYDFSVTNQMKYGFKIRIEPRE